ncbi:branched-chain amino acid ABC transporter permease [Cellulosimicrobium sp. Marseille-Q4280]|uniref:branched-chain amino acid ABC transporter permease n=1 Tax=Cellulosimicrobium sp. Marseille-Q4280 TaxID=2937992 RepID=UPI002041D768|nr:branched-chain amino acid ABC transporter permease [Cellulosimicrobium sp. Marseille-Q4280]
MSRLTGARRTLLLAAVATPAVLVAVLFLDPFRSYQVALVAVYLCATAGLTLVVGLAGQVSLGHAALMAAGGYGYALTANALTDAGLEGGARVVPSLLAGAAVAGALGLLLGLAGARLHGPYLAGLTLALVLALPALATTWSTVLGGDQGVQVAFDGVPEPLQGLLGIEQWQAWVAVVVAAVVVTGLALLRDGRLGLRIRAVRDDAVAARLAGIPAGRVMVATFTASAVGAGLGGAVLCFVTQSVAPGGYGLALSLLLLVAVVLGGLGSLRGAVIGAVLLVLVPWLAGLLADALPVPGDLAQRLDGNLAVLLFGVLLVVVMVAAPGGLTGALQSRSTSRRRRASSAPADPLADEPAARRAVDPSDEPSDEPSDVPLHADTER